MGNQIVELPAGQTIGAMAKYCAASGLFSGYNEPQVATLLLMAQAEGKHPMAAMQEYDIVKGRPALKSSAVFGRFRKAGGKLQWIETSDTVAKCHAEIDGCSVDIEWTIERARKIGLVRNGSGWEKYPAAMLRARAQVEAVRALAPEVLSGLYCAEEVASFDDTPTPRKKSVPATEPVRVESEPVDTSIAIEAEVVSAPAAAEKLPVTVQNEIRACKTITEIGAILKKYAQSYPIELLSAAGTARKQEILEQMQMTGGIIDE